MVGTYMSNHPFTCFAFINFTTDRLRDHFSTIAGTAATAGVRYCICENTRVMVRTKFKDTNTCDTIFIPFRFASWFIDFFALRLAHPITTYLGPGVTLVFAPAALALITSISVTLTVIIHTPTATALATTSALAVIVHTPTTTAFTTTTAQRVCVITRAPYTIATPRTLTVIIGTGTMWAVATPTT